MVRNVGILALLFAAAYFMPYLLNPITDSLFHPWAFKRPPLLAQWIGTLTAGNGARLVVAMDLERDYDSDGMVCSRCNQIKGRAVTCDRQGTVLHYRIAGSPRDRQGRQLHLGAVPVPQPPPDGLELDALAGAWVEPDVLELRAGFFWRRSGAAISSTDDPATQPVPVRMQRTPMASFEGMCAALRNDASRR